MRIIRPLRVFLLCLSVFGGTMLVSRPLAARNEAESSQATRAEETASSSAQTPLNPAEIGPKPNPVEPPGREAIDEAIRGGVDFLVARQNKNGSWGSATRTKSLNIFAPVPGAHHAFRTAVTSLCVTALIESGDTRKEALDALEKGEAWMLEYAPKLRRADGVALYNTWGHAYALTAFAKMYDRLPEDEARREKIKTCMEKQVDLLRRYQFLDGGWGYYDFVAQTQRPAGNSNCFVTATVLVGMHDAKNAAGVEISEKLLKEGMESIRRQRKPDFCYAYSQQHVIRPMYPINRAGGSVGRSQACNVAMFLWEDEATTLPIMKTWLDRLFARNLWLDMGRKRPIPHESWFAVAGYFFYYGHYYAARCIDEIPADERAHFQDHLATILLKLQEKDGSWWDYPLYDYHQQYGTAMAVMSLLRCR